MADGSALIGFGICCCDKETLIGMLYLRRAACISGSFADVRTRVSCHTMYIGEDSFLNV